MSADTLTSLVPVDGAKPSILPNLHRLYYTVERYSVPVNVTTNGRLYVISRLEYPRCGPTPASKRTRTSRYIRSATHNPINSVASEVAVNSVWIPPPRPESGWPHYITYSSHDDPALRTHSANRRVAEPMLDNSIKAPRFHRLVG